MVHAVRWRPSLCRRHKTSTTHGPRDGRGLWRPRARPPGRETSLSAGRRTPVRQPARPRRVRVGHEDAQDGPAPLADVVGRSTLRRSPGRSGRARRSDRRGAGAGRKRHEGTRCYDRLVCSNGARPGGHCSPPAVSDTSTNVDGRPAKELKAVPGPGARWSNPTSTGHSGSSEQWTVRRPGGARTGRDVTAHPCLDPVDAGPPSPPVNGERGERHNRHARQSHQHRKVLVHFSPPGKALCWAVSGRLREPPVISSTSGNMQDQSPDPRRGGRPRTTHG